MNENTVVSPPTTDTSANPTAKDPTDKNLGLLCQLLALSGFIIPFGNVIGPLVLWLIKRAESPYIDAIGKEAVNFNISFLIYGIVAGLSILILIGILLTPAVIIAWVVLVVLAAIKASEGQIYRFPFIIRFIK